MSLLQRFERLARLIRLTRRGRWMLALGLLAAPTAYIVGRVELLYIAALLVLLPFFALIFLRLRLVRMTVIRRFSPEVVTAGKSAVVSVEVQNLSRTGSAEGDWTDSWPWHSPEPATGRLRALSPNRGGRPAASSITRFRYEVKPPRRGVFEIGPLRVSFADPFGLAVQQVEVGGKHTVVVVPDVVPLSEFYHSVAADDGSGRTLQRQAASGVDDLMAREYRIGDALRRVHWRASAHRGDLMVRQEEQHSHAEARILLDTRMTGYRDAWAASEDEALSTSFEWAVRFTASLGLYLRRHGFAVQVVETCARQIASLDQPQEFLESLADLQLKGEEARRFALPSSSGIVGSLGSIFAVVSDADRGVVDRLVAARPAFDTAVAFLVTRRFESLADSLQAAGWACVVVDPEEPLDVAWQAAAQEREAQRGHA